MKGAVVMSSWFVATRSYSNVCQLNRVRLLHGHGQDETQAFIRHLFFLNIRYVSIQMILWEVLAPK